MSAVWCLKGEPQRGHKPQAPPNHPSARPLHTCSVWYASFSVLAIAAFMFGSSCLACKERTEGGGWGVRFVGVGVRGGSCSVMFDSCCLACKVAARGGGRGGFVA